MCSVLAVPCSPSICSCISHAKTLAPHLSIHREKADEWCAATCVAGFCPEDRCKCSGSSIEPELADEQAYPKANAEPSGEEGPSVITEPPGELPVTAAPSDEPTSVSTAEPPDEEASQAPAPAPELEGEPSTALDDAVRKAREEDDHKSREIADRKAREEKRKAQQGQEGNAARACNASITIAGAGGEGANASCFSAPATVRVTGDDRGRVVIWDTEPGICGEGAVFVHKVRGHKPAAMTAGAGELTRHTYMACVLDSTTSVSGTGCQVFSSWSCRSDCESWRWDVVRAGAGRTC
jgi:hypothetical protein